ncbi:MAG: DUF6082 family protein [Streptomyces sp.]
MIADIGMRRDPTGSDIDDLRRLFMESRNGSRKSWGSLGRRLGLSASRFLTGLSEGFVEGRRGPTSRAAVRHRGGHPGDHVASLVTVHDMRLGLLAEAIDNPEFAATLDVYEPAVSPATHRQFLFIEAVYRTYLLEWRIGAMTWEELYGNLRILLQNPIFREYWVATRSRRASLASDSDEARMGHLADELVRELEEAETDEWWTVGEPPTSG